MGSGGQKSVIFSGTHKWKTPYEKIGNDRPSENIIVIK